MLGNNAIYLARQIASWHLIDMDKDKQVETLKNNETIINAFKYAVDDLGTILYSFMSNNRKSNLYGYKMKFHAISEIAGFLKSSIDNNYSWFNICDKDFNRIADDLETMAKILDYEIDNNIVVVDSSEKDYKKMPIEEFV